MSRPEVLVLGQGWSPDDPGGLNRYVRDLLEAFAEEEPLRAVVLGPAGDVPPGVIVAGDAREPLVRRALRFARAARHAGARVAVVDSHFALYALLPVLGPLRRRAQVAHFHGPWAAESAAQGRGGAAADRARAAIERLVYRRADAVVVLSAAFGDLVCRRYAVDPGRVEVIPPGVDLDRFAPGSRAAARERLGLPADARVAVAVRRLDPRMGLGVLLDAWPTVAGRLAGPSLLLVGGEGPLRAELEARVAQVGLAGRVRLLGRVAEEELALLYRAADVAVVPTLALEGFGLVCLEALACGTPVVATDVGGLPEALAGLPGQPLIAAGDAGALAARLVGALDGSAPLADAAACRAHAQRFTWGRAVARHRALYARVTGGTPGAAV